MLIKYFDYENRKLEYVTICGCNFWSSNRDNILCEFYANL